MIKSLLYFIPFFILFLPNLWVNYILRKHNKVLPEMPFTGNDLGNKILIDQEINDVLIQKTKTVDHYNPIDKKINISEDKFDKKSITSISVVAHEAGHAIQDKINYKPLLIRQKLIAKTQTFQRIGSFLLIIGLPSVFAVTKSPFLTLLAGIIIMGALTSNTLIHFITLPVEFDASKRALKILSNYVPAGNMDSCRSVLRAAAFTYLAQSIISIFRLKVILFSLINIFKSIIKR